ncbi:MAG: hypothetical protein ACJ8J0_24215 [Longimicrobiaceae bacterium]
MSDIKPYEPTSPGDLITADLFNRVQVRTQEDILAQLRKAIDALKEVERAGSAAKLEGKTAQQLSDEIIARALREVPQRTGYRMVFRRLRWNEPSIVKHGLKAFPLVDVCQLKAFEVVSSADQMQTVERVNWFLYHRTEMKIRAPRPAGATGTPELVTIEESRGPVFKHTFQSMLDLFGLKYGDEYTDQSTLGDVVNEFWKKLFSDPNDQFEEPSFANSPWMDRCCGDRRTVESLKRGGEWNDLFLKVVPQNIVYAAGKIMARVDHYNLDELGVTVMNSPPSTDLDAVGVQTFEEIPAMVLMKV